MQRALAKTEEEHWEVTFSKTRFHNLLLTVNVSQYSFIIKEQEALNVVLVLLPRRESARAEPLWGPHGYLVHKLILSAEGRCPAYPVGVLSTVFLFYIWSSKRIWHFQNITIRAFSKPWKCFIPRSQMRSISHMGSDCFTYVIIVDVDKGLSRNYVVKKLSGSVRLRKWVKLCQQIIK